MNSIGSIPAAPTPCNTEYSDPNDDDLEILEMEIGRIEEKLQDARTDKDCSACQVYGKILQFLRTYWVQLKETKE